MLDREVARKKYVDYFAVECKIIIGWYFLHTGILRHPLQFSVKLKEKYDEILCVQTTGISNKKN